MYEKGRKHGRSVGRYADGSCWYEDVYDRGVWQQQRIVFAGHPDTLTYTPTDKPASFVGGLAWLNGFIRDNLNYPPDARKAGIEGTVQIRFTVLVDGKLTDIEIAQSVYPALDTEAVRLVKAMDASRGPRWQPATEQGRPVRRQYTLPVHFYAQ
ncbi:MAG: energy transducer TonB [Cytophagales bacterium]|nr:MAG: energy transducer TonB [Cytophagales bacterium]